MALAHAPAIAARPGAGLAKLLREVHQLGLGLNACISRDRLDLLLTWGLVQEALYAGAPHAVYPVWKHLPWTS